MTIIIEQKEEIAQTANRVTHVIILLNVSIMLLSVTGAIEVHIL